MADEIISQKFWLKNNWSKKLFNRRNKSKWIDAWKARKGFYTLNYIEHILISALKITGCVSTSVFASLDGIPIGIMSSVIRLKISAITAAIKSQ